MIDTHAHLNDERLAPRFSEIVGAFDRDGIEAVVNVGADLPSSAVAAAQSGGRVFCALGVHPEGAERTTEADYAELESLIRRTPACIAIGEIGLDYHYPEPSREAQKQCFVRQLETAHRLRLPVILHVREAYGDVIEILKTFKNKLHGGIVHCYSGSAESAKIFVDMGFSIAFGGAITFKNNTHAADVIRSVPRGRLLIETDCPYLTPVPYRGKADNEPKFVRFVAEKTAEALGIGFDDADRLTTENFYRTFGIRRDTVVYPFGGGLYINLTNRCSNRCEFCVRTKADGIGGNNLRLRWEPTAREAIAALTDAKFTRYPEAVFCGFGEPTERADVMIEVARYIKSHGVRTRLNTNGQGNLIAGRDLVPELVGAIDEVSVSLNASDENEYDALCHSVYGVGAFAAMIGFAKECKESGIKVVLSVVDVVGKEEIDRCRTLCAEAGIALKVRAYIDDAAREETTRLNP